MSESTSTDDLELVEIEAVFAGPDEEPKRSWFPSPITILLGVLLAIWLLALVIPSGQYEVGDDGRPIPGSFEEVPSPLDFGDRVRDLLMAPVNGLIGVLDLDTGMVGPFNVGVPFGLAQVFLFILALGAFMTVVFRTGALDLGIAHLAHRFSTRGTLLVVVLCVLFGALGSIMSWSDETLGFYGILVPLMLALGYDRIVAVAVITVAPFVGNIGSTVNPFRTGIGADAAGVPLGEGIGLRVVLLVLLMTVMIIYTTRYANRVKAQPESALVPHTQDDHDLVAESQRDDLPALTGRHKVVIALVAFTFALLTFSIVPWGAILNNTAADPITHKTLIEPFAWELGWWLPELSAMFVIMAFVVGIAGGIGETATMQAFIQGVMDFSGPAIIAMFARATAVVLTNTQTIDTVLSSMEGLVSGVGEVAFLAMFMVVSVPLGFLVGAATAGQPLVMPIFAPLGDFAGVDRSLMVTTYTAIGTWLGLVLPTNAIIMAGLALGKVSYGTYLRFMAPLMGIMLAVIVAVCMVGLLL